MNKIQFTPDRAVLVEDTCLDLPVLEADVLCIGITIMHNNTKKMTYCLIRKEEQTYNNVIDEIQHISNMIKITLERQKIIINPDPDCIISDK